MRDTTFRPRLGRIGAGRVSKKDVNFFKRVARQIAGGGGRRSGRAIQGGAGRPQGTGAKVRASSPYARRVTIKVSVVKVAGNRAAVMAHEQYKERDGVSIDGKKGESFDKVHDRVDVADFVDRCQDDRHQFRLIVSPEDGGELDLRDYTRKLMAQMEADLGTKLDWSAVEHHNTDNPHVHVTVRGVTDQGKDLVIDKAYVSHGMRERACELATVELGPRTELDLQRQADREVGADRLTQLDRSILRTIGDRSELDLATATGSYSGRDYQSLLEARCEHLRGLGLAEETRPGVWRFAPDIDKTLRVMGERGDIIRQMQRDISRAREQCTIYQPSPTTPPLIGKVSHKGLVEGTERRYLIVDGIDGHSHYVDVGKHPEFDRLRNGSVVEIGGVGHVSTKAEQQIADVAARGRGVYTPEAHHALLAETNPRMPEHRREAIVDTHVERLNALEKAGVVTRKGQDAWIVPNDLEAQARNAARQRAWTQMEEKGGKGVMVATLHDDPVSRQVEAHGATWLDKNIANRTDLILANQGFGAELSAALRARADRLVERGHATRDQDGLKARPNLIRALTTEEVERVGNNLAKQAGRPFAAVRDGEQFSGTYVRQLQLSSGRYALLDGQKGFALVPWRPSMEKQLGKTVEGIMRGQSVTLTAARTLSLGL